MPQSLANILTHIIFSTKDRHPFLQNDDIQTEMHSYLAGILRDLNSPVIIVNGVEDHVHILCRISKNHALSKVLEEIKKSSSKWIKTKGTDHSEFKWQRGYGAFSVSQSNADQVRRYIANQEEHHRQVSFQEEYRTFLEKHGIKFDERYVWD